MGDQDAEVVADGVADDADGDAGQDDAAVFHGVGDHRDEEGRVDHGHRGDDRRVGIDLEEFAQQDLQGKGAEDGEGDVEQQPEAFVEVKAADVDHRGDDQAENQHQIHAGVIAFLPFLDGGEEGGGDGERRQREDQDDHVDAAGEEH